MTINVTFYNILGFNLSAADIVGFLLSSVAALVALVSFYHLFKASKVLGGIIGKAFKLIMIGIIFTVTAVAFLGLVFGPLNQYEEMYVAIIGPVVWLAGNFFLLSGFREIIKITKV